jgi:hypothetical protein
VLYSEYRSTEDTTRGTRSGAVLLITSDSVVTVDFKDVEDGLQRRRDAPGQVTVLVRPSARPTRIELAGAQNPAVAVPEGRISEADVRGL